MKKSVRTPLRHSEMDSLDFVGIHLEPNAALELPVGKGLFRITNVAVDGASFKVSGKTGLLVQQGKDIQDHVVAVLDAQHHPQQQLDLYLPVNSSERTITLQSKGNAGLCVSGYRVEMAPRPSLAQDARKKRVTFDLESSEDDSEFDSDVLVLQQDGAIDPVELEEMESEEEEMESEENDAGESSESSDSDGSEDLELLMEPGESESSAEEEAPRLVQAPIKAKTAHPPKVTVESSTVKLDHKIVCPPCKRTFRTKQALTQHQSAKH